MLIIEAKAYDPSWDDWKREHCQCGYRHCTKFDLSFSWAEGKLDERDSRLAVAAPKLLKALVGIVGREIIWGVLDARQQEKALEALQAALGKENVTLKKD